MRSLGFIVNNNVRFSPWQSFRPAVTFRPALCGSEPPARPRCPAEEEVNQSHKEFLSANQRAAKSINQSKGEGEAQQEWSTSKKWTAQEAQLCID